MITLFVAALALPLSALDLSGNVVSADGKQLENAHVYVFTALPKVGPNTICPSCYRDCGKREKIAADGTFTIRDLDEKLKFRLLAVADGYEPQFSNYVEAGPVRFKLQPRVAEDLERLVRGTVLDPDGKPVVGAIVEPQGLRVGKRTGYGRMPGLEQLSITNEKGEFALRIPDPSAELDVRVRARNYAPEIARHLKPCTEDQIVRVDLGAAIVGRLLREGKPQPGMRVVFDHRDRNSANFLGREVIATDDKGTFTMTGLGPDQEYYVFIDDMKNDPTIKRDRMVKVGGDGTSVELGEVELK